MSNLFKIFGVGIITGFVVFIVLTQVLGVPFWWIVEKMLPMSIAPEQRLSITVSPEKVLWSIGDATGVTVVNSSSRLPVQDATVHVMKDDVEIDYYTDSSGQISFEYLGEPTIILVEKEGFQSVHTVIPKLPDLWIRELAIGLGGGIVGGLVSGISTKLLSDRKKESAPQSKQKKVRRRPSK